MKIYRRVVIDMNTMSTVEEDSFDYEGPVALCGGKGKTKSESTTVVEVDKEYNARMAAIAEEAQLWSREMYNQFKYGVNYNPYEVDRVSGRTLGEIMGYDPAKTVSEMQLMQKRIEAEYGLLPLYSDVEREGLQYQRQKYQTEASMLGIRADTERMGLGLQQRQIAAEESLLGQRTDTERSRLEAELAMARDRMKTIGERSPVISKLYEEALSGVNAQARVDQARANVQHGFAAAADQTRRDLSRMGIDPNSGRGAAAFRNVDLAKASALAGASTAAQTQAENEKFERLRAAVGLPTL